MEENIADKPVEPSEEEGRLRGGKDATEADKQLQRELKVSTSQPKTERPRVKPLGRVTSFSVFTDLEADKQVLDPTKWPGDRSPEEILTNYKKLVEDCKCDKRDAVALLSAMAARSEPDLIKQNGLNIFTGEIRPPPPSQRVGKNSPEAIRQTVHQRPARTEFIEPPQPPSGRLDLKLRNSEKIYPTRAKNLGDTEIAQTLGRLKFEIEDFAFNFFGWEERSATETRDALKDVLSSPELMHYMTWSSIVEVERFHELFERPDTRHCLVYGVIARALKIHVFDSLLFGAPEDQLQALHAHEIATRNSEGFARTAVRRTMTRSLLAGQRVPSHFSRNLRQTTCQIFTLISPLLLPASHTAHQARQQGLHPSLQKFYPRLPALHSLFQIVEIAALLSVDMRSSTAEDDVVYHFFFPAKDSAPNEEAMEVLNREAEFNVEIEQGRARAAEKRRAWYAEEARLKADFDAEKAREVARREASWWSGKGGEVEEKKAPEPELPWSSPAKHVMVSAFPEVTVYRPGGPLKGQEKKGFRYRRLARAAVLLRFGDGVKPEKGREWDGFFERGVERTLERTEVRVKEEEKAGRQSWGWFDGIF